MRISDWSSDVCSSDLVVAQQIAAAQPGMEPADLHAAFRQRREEAFRRVLASEVVDDERNVDTALPRVADGVPNAVADGVSCNDIIEEQEFASFPISIGTAQCRKRSFKDM